MKPARILAIDPGTDRTAWVVMNAGDKSIVAHNITQNPEMFQVLADAVELYGAGHMAIEMMASMGMAVGQSVFETAVWIGRFIQAWTSKHGESSYELIYRADEKMHLCGNPRAKDSNIRQVILDAYSIDPDTLQRINPVGNKRFPGPLYGISNDEWSAIAVAKVALETNLENRVNKRSHI